MPFSIRRAVVVAALLLAGSPAPALATWSVIVVDRRTGVIGVAAASCVSDVHGIAALAPGRGALVAQAMVHGRAMREAIRMLREGAAPDSILRAISAAAIDTATQDRQYAIATIASGQAQFTGGAIREHRGQRSADGVLVQGGLLAGPAVLDAAIAAVERARAAGRPMEDVLMAALRAGADAGGDARCGAQRATAAFVTVARPGDNPAWPYLTLRVVDAPRGGRVRAVDLLEARLALWRANGGPALRITAETVKPDSLP